MAKPPIKDPYREPKFCQDPDKSQTVRTDTPHIHLPGAAIRQHPRGQGVLHREPGGHRVYTLFGTFFATLNLLTQNSSSLSLSSRARLGRLLRHSVFLSICVQKPSNIARTMERLTPWVESTGPKKRTRMGPKQTREDTKQTHMDPAASRQLPQGPTVPYVGTHVFSATH